MWKQSLRLKCPLKKPNKNILKNLIWKPKKWQRKQNIKRYKKAVIKMPSVKVNNIAVPNMKELYRE